jgi:hypothetical protein
MGRGSVTGDGWAILGHRLSMPGCRGRKAGRSTRALALWRTVVVLAGHQREMRSTHLTARLSANLLVRCPRSHGECYARVVADTSSGTRKGDTANRGCTLNPLQSQSEKRQSWFSRSA